MIIPVINILIGEKLKGLKKVFQLDQSGNQINSHFDLFYFDIFDEQKIYFSKSVNSEVIDKVLFKNNFNSVYESKVNVTTGANFIHINIISDLTDDKSPSKLEFLIENFDWFKSKFHFDIKVLLFGISGSLVKEITNRRDINISRLEVQTNNFNLAFDLSNKNKFNFICIENKNSEGLNLQLRSSDISKIIIEFSSLLSINYFDFSFFFSHNKPYSLGISSVYFDYNELEDILLTFSLQKIFDQSGIGDFQNKEVDSVKVNKNTMNICAPYLDLYSSFYQWFIKLNIDPNTDLTKYVKQFFEIFETEFLEFLNSKDLTLQEKKVVLKLIIGEDDDSSVGYDFDPFNISSLFDIEYQTADFFIKKSDVKITLNQIKSIRQAIRNKKNYIKQKEKELKNLIVNSPQYENNKGSKDYNLIKKTKENLKWSGENTNPLVSETFIKKFEASPDIDISQKLDLRKYFSSDLSARTDVPNFITAIIKVYEYYEARNSKNVRFSAEYVFKKLNKNYGSETQYSQLDIINVFRNSGVCEQKIFEKTKDEEYIKEQSEKRKLVELQSIDINKTDFLNALNQGYPIVAEIQIFDSFFEHFNMNNGVVRFPTEEEKTKKETHLHSIVLCGYEKFDETYVFVALSTWGESFGHNSFIYLTADYLFDSTFTFNSFIISKIDGIDFNLGYSKDLTEMSFGLNESSIQIPLLESIIRSQKYEIEKLNQLYSKEYRDYNRLMQNLLNPSIRRSLTGLWLNELNEEIIKIEEEINSKKNIIKEHKNELFNFESKKKKYIIFGIGALLTSFSFFIFAYFIPGIFLLVTFLILIYLYLTAKIDFVDVDTLEKEIKELELKLVGFIERRKNLTLEGDSRGYLIDQIFEFKNNIKERYHFYSNLVDKLKNYHEIIQNELKITSSKSLGPFLPLVQNEEALTFFNKELSQSYEDKIFSDYIDLKTEDNISKSLKTLKSEIREVNSKVLKKFNFEFEEYILGEKTYPFLPIASPLEKYATHLQRYSLPFLHLRNLKLNINSDINRMLFVPENEHRLGSLTNKISSHFSSQPINKDIDKDFNKILFVQLKEISDIEDVVISKVN